MQRAVLKGILAVNRLGKSAAVRLTRLTGKSRVRIHPKHLLDGRTGLRQGWYLERLVRGMRVLDVGCGNGVHTLRAARAGARVAGIDYDPGQLRVGRRLAAERGTPGAFALGRLERGLPFAPSAFDAVLLLDVIEHLHRRVELLGEIHRVLRPSGLLFVSAPNADTGWKRRLRAAGLFAYTDADHKIEYSLPALRDELAAGGFEVLGEPQPIVYDTPWAGLIDLTGGFSLALYRRLAQWKVDQLKRHPEDTIGWRLVCRRLDRPAAAG